MSTIVKGAKENLKRHAVGVNGKPLCGGGHGAKSSDYQIDLGDDVDCEPCLVIIEKQRVRKEIVADLVKHPWKGALPGSWRVVNYEGFKGLAFRDRFRNGRVFSAMSISCLAEDPNWNFDDDLLELIVQGLNAIYPPPRKNEKTPGAEADYEI